MTDLLKLAERCEGAEGPSYVLDCAIWDCIYPGERQARFDRLTAKGQPYHGRPGPADVDGYVKPLRAFTASIDSALTLVPEGMGYGVADPKHGVSASGLIFHRDGLHIERRASTPALALCAAALRVWWRGWKK